MAIFNSYVRNYQNFPIDSMVIFHSYVNVYQRVLSKLFEIAQQNQLCYVCSSHGLGDSE